MREAERIVQSTGNNGIANKMQARSRTAAMITDMMGPTEGKRENKLDEKKSEKSPFSDPVLELSIWWLGTLEKSKKAVTPGDSCPCSFNVVVPPGQEIEHCRSTLDVEWEKVDFVIFPVVEQEAVISVLFPHSTVAVSSEVDEMQKNSTSAPFRQSKQPFREEAET